MKKKLLLLALVITALVSVFTLSAFAAEETPALEIKGANLSFADSVYIRYAVAHEGIEADNIQMLFWTAPQDSMDDYVIGTEDYSFRPLADEETVGGASCVVFENDTLRAKNMTDYVYARAYAEVDGTVYYSEVNKYSILQYAYNKLGKTGAASESETLKKMLEAMLSYGAAAQLHFDHEADRPADADFYQVKVEGGTLPDGFAKGLYLAGETVTLTAPEAIRDTVFVGWQNAAGETVAETAVATVTVTAQNEVYTATYKEAVTYSEGLKFVSNGDGTCYVAGIGTCTDTDLRIPPVSPEGYTVTAIGDYAFEDKTSFISVVIPDSVTSIGDFAFAYCDSLTSVTIPDSVTSIGDFAFASCYSLTSVTIPDSVMSLGDNVFSDCVRLADVILGNGITTISEAAFFACTGLTSITIPDSIITIGNDAFAHCGITSLTIPDSVTSIGDGAFEDCSYLTSATIPDSVTYIGNEAFALCTSLTWIEAGTDGVYYSINGNLYTDTTLLQYACGKTDSSFTIPHGVTKIGNAAFAGCCDYLTSIVITNDVTSIGNEAFWHCCNLTNVTIGNSVVTIGEAAFMSCDSLTSVTIPASVQSIGSYAFSWCSNLATVAFVEDSQLSTIDVGAFYYCKSITSVYYGGTAESWSNITIGANNENLTNATRYYYSETAPTKEGNFWHYVNGEIVIWPAFTYSEGLEFVSNGDGTCYVKGIGTCTDTDLRIPPVSPSGDSVTAIGKKAFQYNDTITSVIIPDSVSTIGDYAFYWCSNLTSVVIGNSVTSIGSDAFAYCTSLTWIEAGRDGTYYSINGNLYTGTTLVQYACGKTDTYFTIPNSVTSIGSYAFYDCDSLTSVAIPDSVTSIGYGAFFNCTSLASVTIPDSVTSIGNSAFALCTSLTSVTIGNSVTTIGEDAFYGCDSLTSVTIENSVTSIGSDAFAYCAHLTWIEAGRDGTYYSIDGNLYTGTTLVQYACGKTDTYFTIPNSVTSIGSHAFSNCDSLTSVTIPDSVTSIGSYAFCGCYSLTSVTIPDSVTSIGRYAFYACDSLTSVTIPESVTSIDGMAFSSGDSLTSVYYTGTAEKWAAITIGLENENLTNATRYYYSETAPTEEGDFWHYVNGEIVIWPEYVAPSYSEGLKFVSNGDGTCYVAGIGTCTDTDLRIPPVSPEGYKVTKIRSSAFADCDSLTNVTIPDSVTTIGDDAFADCDSLTSVTIPDSVTTIGDDAFAYCNSLTSVTIPESVQSIGFYAFYHCSSLTSVVIPDGVTTIGYYVFEGCKNLTSVVIPDSVQHIGYRMFFGCNSLTSITIPDSVTYIDSNAFTGCSSLTSVTIPDSVTYIGESAFSLCTSLTSVTIPDSVTSIGHHAFTSCFSLTSVTIGNSVTAIGSYAFSGCSNLTSITNIPDSVTAIGNGVFYGCSSLTSILVDKNNTTYQDIDGNLYNKDGTNLIHYAVGKTAISFTIPDGVTSINADAFGNCTGLTSIIIPDSVTSIGQDAFYNCCNLTSITIPDSVTNIGDHAFYGCSGLTNVYYTGTSTDWATISIGSSNDPLNNATLYYYSETEPNEEGNFWHYVDGEIVVW